MSEEKLNNLIIDESESIESIEESEDNSKETLNDIKKDAEEIEEVILKYYYILGYLHKDEEYKYKFE